MDRLLDGRDRRMWTPALVAAGTMMLATGMAVPVAGQVPSEGVYTAAQAESGRAIYERECAVCHQSNAFPAGRRCQGTASGGTSRTAWCTVPSTKTDPDRPSWPEQQSRQLSWLVEKR